MESHCADRGVAGVAAVGEHLLAAEAVAGVLVGDRAGDRLPSFCLPRRAAAPILTCRAVLRAPALSSDGDQRDDRAGDRVRVRRAGSGDGLRAVTEDVLQRRRPAGDRRGRRLHREREGLGVGRVGHHGHQVGCGRAVRDSSGGTGWPRWRCPARSPRASTVTVVQSGDWRTKATGGLTAPAAASVTRPLRLRATVLRESSAERYPTGGVTAGRVSIVNVGPDGSGGRREGQRGRGRAGQQLAVDAHRELGGQGTPGTGGDAGDPEGRRLDGRREQTPDLDQCPSRSRPGRRRRSRWRRRSHSRWPPCRRRTRRAAAESGAVTANAFDDVEPSTAETFASQVDLSVATAEDVSVNRRARLVGWAAAVVGWVGARASYVTRSNVTQNAPEQVFWGAGATAWTGWTSVPVPISSATRPAARAVRRFMGFPLDGSCLLHAQRHRPTEVTGGPGHRAAGRGRTPSAARPPPGRPPHRRRRSARSPRPGARCGRAPRRRRSTAPA